MNQGATTQVNDDLLPTLSLSNKQDDSQIDADQKHAEVTAYVAIDEKKQSNDIDDLIPTLNLNNASSQAISKPQTDFQAPTQEAEITVVAPIEPTTPKTFSIPELSFAPQSNPAKEMSMEENILNEQTSTKQVETSKLDDPMDLQEYMELPNAQPLNEIETKPQDIASILPQSNDESKTEKFITSELNRIAHDTNNPSSTVAFEALHSHDANQKAEALKVMQVRILQDLNSQIQMETNNPRLHPMDYATLNLNVFTPDTQRKIEIGRDLVKLIEASHTPT